MVSIQYIKEQIQPLNVLALTVWTHQCLVFPHVLFSPVTPDLFFPFISVCKTPAEGMGYVPVSWRLGMHEIVSVPQIYFLPCSVHRRLPSGGWAPGAPALAGSSRPGWESFPDVSSPGCFPILGVSLHPAYTSVNIPFTKLFHLHPFQSSTCTLLAPWLIQEESELYIVFWGIVEKSEFR